MSTAVESLDDVATRPESEDDREFLLAVFASARAFEMDLLDWSDARKEQFLRMQFHAQSSHYRQYYQAADFLIILVGSVPAGRLCIHRGGSEMRIVDIALLPEFRGRGVGTKLLRGVLEEADMTGAAVTMHVEKSNRAQDLYRRLGFDPVEDKDVHWLMRREPSERGALA